MLAQDGILIIEEPYLPDIIRKNAFDQFYDEHIYYFSALSLERILAQFQLELIRTLPLPTHGGSMRYYARWQESVRTLRRDPRSVWEEDSGALEFHELSTFAHRVSQNREKLATTVQTLAARGETVAGYGATAKSTSVINSCGLTTKQLSYICDNTPSKIGKYSPGARIPIVSDAIFRTSPPEVAVLFAWNHGSEVLTKETNFQSGGGRWLTYVPEVQLT